MKPFASVFLLLLCLGISCKSPHIDNENTVPVVVVEEDTLPAMHAMVTDEKADFIKTFYNEYVRETCREDGSRPDMKKVGRIVEKYCSKDLLIKTLGADYDVFLNTQDFDASWLDILEIKADPTEESWYMVSCSYDDSDKKKHIETRVKVVPTDHSYRIVDIR